MIEGTEGAKGTDGTDVFFLQKTSVPSGSSVPSVPSSISVILPRLFLLIIDHRFPDDRSDRTADDETDHHLIHHLARLRDLRLFTERPHAGSIASTNAGGQKMEGKQPFFRLQDGQNRPKYGIIL